MNFDHNDFNLTHQYVHIDAIEALTELGILGEHYFKKPVDQILYYLQPDGNELHVFDVKPDGKEVKSTIMTLDMEEMRKLAHEEFFLTQLEKHGLYGAIYHPTENDGPINDNCYVVASERRPYDSVLADYAYLVNQAQDYMDPADWQRFKDIYDEFAQFK